MERLKHIEAVLIGQIQAQLERLHDVDAKELGEVIDMVKDLEEAIYYCTVVEAMEGTEKSHTMYYKDMTHPKDRMYYGGDSERGSGSWEGTDQWVDRPRMYPHDKKEGRSHLYRKTYMEAKEMHHDKTKLMTDLEQYMQELSNDIVEMIEDATAEEKMVLQKKLQTLAQKVM